MADTYETKLCFDCMTARAIRIAYTLGRKDAKEGRDMDLMGIDDRVSDAMVEIFASLLKEKAVVSVKPNTD